MLFARSFCIAALALTLSMETAPAAAQPPAQAETLPSPQRLPPIAEEVPLDPSHVSLQPRRIAVVAGTILPSYSPTPPRIPDGLDIWTHYGGKARAYYLNDQRIEFTGLEATFAVEGVLNGGVHQRVDDWDCMVEGELFINQPFDRNVLTDTPLRQSFAANFNVEPLQISQLYLAARKNHLLIQAGRFVTPFGRFYYPIYLNNFSDSPFIRSEAIIYRETGVLAQWDPDGFVFTVALTNGGFEKDTNSSKALIARAGIDRGWFACGASIKQQDGNGSEQQKEFNNHVGLDAMVRWGSWTLSGEVIYDEFGFRRPGFNPNDIFWGRSIYFRDLSSGTVERPLTGVGYYVNLGYEGPRWTAMLNYGDFFPRQQLGIPLHDTPIHRGLIKTSYHATVHFETYGVLLVENSVPGLDGHLRRGLEVIAGCQFSM